MVPSKAFESASDDDEVLQYLPFASTRVNLVECRRAKRVIIATKTHGI
jgi:hypothetical protein